MKKGNHYSITVAQIFLCEVFGISRKELKQNTHPYNNSRSLALIHRVSFWQELTIEEFEILCNIIQDEFELGDVKIDIFFDTMHSYRLKYDNKRKKENYVLYSNSPKGKAILKKAQEKYRLKLKERSYKNGRID